MITPHHLLNDLRLYQKKCGNIIWLLDEWIADNKDEELISKISSLQQNISEAFCAIDSLDEYIINHFNFLSSDDIRKECMSD